jgi:hypothetical protein
LFVKVAAAMRPYLAIIKDSFREALASRVLWVLTGLIVLLLLALAPIGYKRNLTAELTWGDIVEAPQLVEKLQAASQASAPSPGKRIWSLLDESTRDKISKIQRPTKEGEGRDFLRAMEELRKGLNGLIRRNDLYRAEDWAGVTLPKEAKEFLDKPRDQLNKQEAARLNRLLVESAAPANFRPRSVYSISISYLWFETDPLPFSKEQVDSFVKEWVLTTAIGWIVGVFGMIAAILVTSTIIPQMFDPGSITLLLSKPISRSLLFTAKFIGGCAFILLNVSLLITGVWLIAGARFGIWNHGLLWCIPIFLFMFLIYYAVSALTGLIWKSAIISVIVTVLFYVACFLVDLVSEVVKGAFLDQQRISRIVTAEGELLAITEGGRFQVWDADARTWRTVAEPRGGGGIPTIDGPFWHEPSRQLLVGQGFRSPFGFGGQRVSLRVGRAGDGWTLRDGPSVPTGTAALALAHDSAIIAVTQGEVYQLTGNPSAQGTSFRFLGMRVPLTGGGEFRPCLADDDLSFPDPLAITADQRQPRLAICAGKEVYLLGRQADDQYKLTARRTLEGKENDASAVAMADQSVLVAREDGTLWLLAAGDLAVKKQFTLEKKTQPRFVAADAAGQRFAVLFQNRYLWLVDATTGEARRAPIGAQGQISGFTWTADKLLVGDYANRVVAYDQATFARLQVYRPSLTRVELAYYYVVKPLHTIFPKPRMLNNTVQYVLTQKRTTDLGLFQGDLTQQREDLDPWRPVRSGMVFVGVMLLIACIYIERHEF